MIGILLIALFAGIIAGTAVWLAGAGWIVAVLAAVILANLGGLVALLWQMRARRAAGRGITSRSLSPRPSRSGQE